MHLTVIVLSDCPHCLRALELLEKIRRGDKELQAVPVSVIRADETPEEAADYDYCYVPAFFIGEKLWDEGSLTKARIKEFLSLGQE